MVIFADQQKRIINTDPSTLNSGIAGGKGLLA